MVEKRRSFVVAPTVGRRDRDTLDGRRERDTLDAYIHQLLDNNPLCRRANVPYDVRRSRHGFTEYMPHAPP
jgi:hypothetical protein